MQTLSRAYLERRITVLVAQSNTLGVTLTRTTGATRRTLATAREEIRAACARLRDLLPDE